MLVRIAALTAAFVASTASASAADWQVRRATTSGVCSIQSSDSQPTLGQLLTSKPTKKEACEAAKSLKTSDAADSSKCFDYTPNTRSFCQGQGVALP